MNLTNEQEQIVTHSLKPGECLKITAFAGTGKTSTFVELTKKYPQNNYLYLAFNKAVSDEAQRKFGINVVPKTIHALAYGSVGHKFSNIVNSLKSWEITKLLRCPLYEASIIRLSLENFLNSADMCPLPDHVVEDELNMLEQNYKENCCNAVTLLWDAMCKEQIGMSHGGYLKLYQLQKPKLNWETILLDEAQDTNPVTLALVVDQLQYGTKLILCGDPYQQIYSWRGAIDAMAKVDCHELRLTKSFRFGDNICDVANSILKHLLGEQIPILGTEQNEPDRKSATICRTNSGLLQAAAAHDKFCVVGEPRFLQLLSDVMDVYHIRKGQPYKCASKFFKFVKSYDELCEKTTLTLDQETQIKINLVEQYGSEIPELLPRIRNSISVSSDNVIVTGHQAKGLEWTSVRLHSDFPSLQDTKGKTKKVMLKTTKNDEDFLSREECNLIYVACTRAKKMLNPGHSVERFLNETKQQTTNQTNETEQKD